ncbi:MAG: hypothetical protein ACRET2_08200, partial [Steroidobacteraceae bacterium]
MTATDRRPQAPRTAGLSILALASALLGLGALLPGSQARAQGVASAAEVPFPQGRAAMGGELPPAAYAQLKWRLVGPFRGGWATMAAGVPASPDTFYFSGAGGGIWKTQD